MHLLCLQSYFKNGTYYDSYRTHTAIFCKRNTARFNESCDITDSLRQPCSAAYFLV